MNISLTPELESLVQETVKSGRYHSASEVIRDALRMFEERDQLRKIKLESLRKEVAMGLAQLDRGEGKPMDFDALKTRIRAHREAKR